MLVKRRLSPIFLFVFTIALSVTIGLAFAGTLIEDFDDGDAEGWERSPQNGDNDNVVWEVVDDACLCQPKSDPFDHRKLIHFGYFL